MTAMADLGLVTDAPQLLVELANRFGVTDPGATQTTADASTAAAASTTVGKAAADGT